MLVHTAGEFKFVVFDLATETLEVTTHKCIFRGIRVNVSPDADVEINNGTAPAFLIPSGQAVGPDPFFDVTMPAGITLDAGEGATGEIVFIFAELP
jgi:hypothetical protein